MNRLSKPGLVLALLALSSGHCFAQSPGVGPPGVRFDGIAADPASQAAPSVSYRPGGPMASAAVGKVLSGFQLHPPETTRGIDPSNAEEVFANRCRSVALVVVETAKGAGSGTGSVITAQGQVLTAAHVVRAGKQVVVGLFPNCDPGAQPVAYAASVTKVDDVADLALVQIAKPPAALPTMPIGNPADVRPGSTVLMIGHPQELLMSLSRGLVSAIRPRFQWDGGDGVKRQATVIQTDGAINPGNSGGPMMSTAGSLVGVNSFIAGEASAGLNFAVSVAEVRQFLDRPDSRIRKPQPAADASTQARAGKCEPKSLRKGREGDATVEFLDLTCSGKANGKFVLPDDKSKPAELWVDRSGSGRADVVFYDVDRDGSPDYSLWDDDHNGSFAWRGEHAKGDWQPLTKTRVAKTG